MTGPDNTANGFSTTRRVTRREFLTTAAGAGLAATGLAGLGALRSPGAGRLVGVGSSNSRLASSSRSAVNFNFWEPSGDALGTRTMMALTHGYNQTVGPVQASTSLKTTFPPRATTSSSLKRLLL